MTHGSVTVVTEKIGAEIIRTAESAFAAAAEDLRSRLAAQTEGAGLGHGLARSWKKKLTQSNSHTSATVFTTSSKIISAYAYGTTIRGRNGNWLAIPVEGAVPLRDGFGRVPMSPVEVEARFNQDLQFVRFPGGRTAGLVMSLVRAQSGRGWRAATPGRAAQGRKAERVLMFVLVHQVQIAKRLDIPRAIAETMTAFGANVSKDTQQ